MNRKSFLDQLAEAEHTTGTNRLTHQQPQKRVLLQTSTPTKCNTYWQCIFGRINTPLGVLPHEPYRLNVLERLCRAGMACSGKSQPACPLQHRPVPSPCNPCMMLHRLQAMPTGSRVHSKLKGQNSRTFQGLLKDLKLQFSSTKSIDKKIYHTRATSNFRVKYIL